MSQVSFGDMMSSKWWWHHVYGCSHLGQVVVLMWCWVLWWRRRTACCCNAWAFRQCCRSMTSWCWRAQRTQLRKPSVNWFELWRTPCRSSWKCHWKWMPSKFRLGRMPKHELAYLAWAIANDSNCANCWTCIAEFGELSPTAQEACKRHARGMQET